MTPAKIVYTLTTMKTPLNMLKNKNLKF